MNRNYLLKATAVIMLFLGGIACEPRYEEYDMNGYYALQYLLGNRSGYPDYGTYYNLIDNRDGTVSVNYSSPYTEGKTVYRKCLAGQTYRETENDCRGTGDSSDNYGASTLEYCSVNDYSCNTYSTSEGTLLKTSLSGSGVSEVYTACAGDTTAGLSWKAPSSYQLNALKTSGFFDDYQDSPIGEYWTRNWDNSLASKAIYVNIDLSYGNHANAEKTEKKYVICVQNQ